MLLLRGGRNGRGARQLENSLDRCKDVRRLDQIHARIGMPLALSGVAACVFTDLHLTPDEGEMLFLMLRLPGAAAHALEQKVGGFRRFPFYPVELAEAA